MRVGRVLLEHYERFLGRYEDAVDRYCDASSYQILGFKAQPLLDAHTYVTLGISTHCLRQGSEGSPDVRMELMACAWDVIDSMVIIRMLRQIGDSVIACHTATEDGAVLEYASAPDRRQYAYCTHPLFFPDEFVLIESTDPPTVIGLLFPLTAREAVQARLIGHDFNRAVIEQKPDLLSFDRRVEMQWEG